MIFSLLVLFRRKKSLKIYLSGLPPPLPWPRSRNCQFFLHLSLLSQHGMSTRVACPKFRFLELRTLTKFVATVGMLQKKHSKAETIDKITVHSQVLQHYFFLSEIMLLTRKYPNFGRGVQNGWTNKDKLSTGASL